MPAVPIPIDRPTVGPTAGVPARERILKAASVLFYRHGVRAVGVNGVIAAADVAKATFYQHFPSKDDLIVAWLRGDDAQWFDRLRTAAEHKAAAQGDVVPAFFDALAEWAATDDFRGWGFINSAAELPASHPAHEVIVERGELIEAYFCDAIMSAGIDDAKGVAQDAYLLMVGAVAASATRGNPEPAQRAAVSIRRLLGRSE